MVGRYALLEKAQNHILTHVESVDDQSDQSKPMSYLFQSCAVYGAGIVFSGGYLNRQWDQSRIKLAKAKCIGFLATPRKCGQRTALETLEQNL